MSKSRNAIKQRTRQIGRAIGGTPQRIRASTIVRKTDFPIRPPRIPLSVDPQPIQSATGVNFKTDWARREPSRLVRTAIINIIVRPIVTGLARPVRAGQDRLQDLEGPVIFAANHHSHVDTPLLVTSIPNPWRRNLVVGAAADYFFSTRVTGVLSALAIGAIPIERNKVDRRSSDLASDLINQGWSFMIFPEGGRSPDGWGQPFRAGAAYLSIKCDVPVVPVHLMGTGRILRKGKSRPTPSRTQVTFGSPLRADISEPSRRFAERIESAVSELADESQTDWWQARLRANSSGTPSLYGPNTSSWQRLWLLGDQRPSSRRQQYRWPKL